CRHGRVRSSSSPSRSPFRPPHRGTHRQTGRVHREDPTLPLPTEKRNPLGPGGPPMPAPATIDELVDLSQKSGILDRKGLDDYLQRVRSGPSVPTGPQDLAAAMVRDGLLTRFQADQLLQG